MTTLEPKYILYSYMEPLGLTFVGGRCVILTQGFDCVRHGLFSLEFAPMNLMGAAVWGRLDHLSRWP